MRHPDENQDIFVIKEILTFVRMQDSMVLDPRLRGDDV
jgi:hypothetical protein